MGADFTIKDKKGDTPKDLAHTWVQKELEDAASGKVDPSKNQQGVFRGHSFHIGYETKEFIKSIVPNQSELASYVKEVEEISEKFPSLMIFYQEVLKIYFTNGSYKSIRLNSSHTAGQLASLVAEKIHLPEYGHYFDVIESKKEGRTFYYQIFQS